MEDEKVNMAFEHVCQAIAGFASAVAELGGIWAAMIAGDLNKLLPPLMALDLREAEWAAALEYAKETRPQWVHTYRHTRKKRTRKKYEKKILKHWRDCSELEAGSNGKA